jgi:hypothetical protein
MVYKTTLVLPPECLETSLICGVRVQEEASRCSTRTIRIPLLRGAGRQCPSLSGRWMSAWPRRSCDAVFRYQLQQRLTEAPHPPRYYVAQQGRDPTDAVLGRLRALGATVQPLSQCRVTAREGVVDRTTGARGIIVQVARLSWLHAAAVDVVGRYYITHRHAAGLRYRVEHDGRRWAVTTTSLLWRV